jgi:anthranilate phosphoribosyltransferase
MYLKAVIDGLLQGQSLDQNTSEALFAALLEGNIPPVQIAAILTLLAQRGPAADEVTGAVKALKSRMIPVHASVPVMDCCGTGGDVAGTYNISTAVSFVLAGLGETVAKHGNRSASSQCGAADVLEELGVMLTLPPHVLAKALEDCRIAFIFAPNHHPALRQVAPIRQDLGFRTIFNALGPLLNPASPQKQLIGVYSEALMPLMAQAARATGIAHSLIVHGAGNLDEISLTGESTLAWEDTGGKLNWRKVTPVDFNLPAHDIKDLKGGNAQVNAAALMALLGGEKSAYRDTVLANAAACLAIEDPQADLKPLVKRAALAIDDGAALAAFKAYRDFSQANV